MTSTENNCISNLSQAATLWRGRNSVFRLFFQHSPVYTMQSHLERTQGENA